MTPDDLISLRRKLREWIIVRQVSLPALAKACGVSVKALGEFFADGPLADDQALYLHSYLHFEKEEEKDLEGRLERGEYVPLEDKFRILQYELKKNYGLIWPLHRPFMELARYKRQLELKHMEERAKMELLKRHAALIEHWRLVFPDGSSYWDWKKKLGAYQKKALARGAKPYGARKGNDISPRRRSPSPHLPWRG
jgi:hypothetical protein